MQDACVSQVASLVRGIISLEKVLQSCGEMIEYGRTGKSISQLLNLPVQRIQINVGKSGRDYPQENMG